MNSPRFKGVMVHFLPLESEIGTVSISLVLSGVLGGTEEQVCACLEAVDGNVRE